MSDNLPPLPEPHIAGGVMHAPIEGTFTASQMRAYALQAVAAERVEAQQRALEYLHIDARCDRLENEAERLRAERDAAEDALHRHGYRKSCSIPACNCGDQWNHGGHAATRLREISEELCDLQGGTLLDKLKALRAERDALLALLKEWLVFGHSKERDARTIAVIDAARNW